MRNTAVCATNITARPMIAAAMATLLCAVGCAALLWSDRKAYADLPNWRLQQSVGVKGTCCTPPLKTACEAGGMIACTNTGVVCEPGTSTHDSCGSPSCDDADGNDEKCDSSLFANLTVSVSVCTITSSAYVPCGTGGTRCAYVTSEAVMSTSGCGSADFCSTTSGAACQ